MSADCDVSHRNLDYTSNSEREIGGRFAGLMLQSSRYCNYDFPFDEVFTCTGHLTSLGIVNFFLLKMFEAFDATRDASPIVRAHPVTLSFGQNFGQ